MSRMSAANRREAYLEDHPHHGDGEAASMVEDVFPAFHKIIRRALDKCQSDEAQEVLAHLHDEALVNVAIWIERCREEGEIPINPIREAAE